MENTSNLPPVPASLFHAAASKFTITAYCPTCWKETRQDFIREDHIFEYYECENCGQLHPIAVR